MHPRIKRESGGLESTSFLWYGLLLVALYFGVAFVPSYAENWEVKAVVREAVNMGHKEPSDAKLREFILRKCRSLGSHYEEEDGALVNKVGVVLADDDVAVERDTEKSRITVTVTYKKLVIYPFTRKSKTLTFRSSGQESLEPVKW